MKPIFLNLLVIISVFLSSTAWAEETSQQEGHANAQPTLCEQTFTAESIKAAMAGIEDIDKRIENLRRQEWWRENVRGAEQPSHFEYLRSQRYFLRQALKSGNIANAISMTNFLFQKVERAILLIEIGQKAIAADLENILQEEGFAVSSDVRAQFEEIVEKQKQILVEHYDEYENLRGILERAAQLQASVTGEELAQDLADAEFAPQQEAKPADEGVESEETAGTPEEAKEETLTAAAVAYSEQETLKQTARFIMTILDGKIKYTLAPLFMLGLRTERPSLDDVHAFVRSSREIQMRVDELITSKERKAGWGAVFLQFVGGRNSPVHRFLATHTPLFAKMLSDDLCLSVYFPRIESFLNLGSPQKPIEEHFRFLFVNYGADGQAFLVAYFRHPETLPYHAQLLEYAGTQTGKESFAKAVAAANEKASHWGALSPSRKLKSWARRVPLIASAVGVILTAAYNNWFPTDTFTPIDTPPAVLAPLDPVEEEPALTPQVEERKDSDSAEKSAPIHRDDLSSEGFEVEEVETPTEIQNQR